jgi:hypothetical protein
VSAPLGDAALMRGTVGTSRRWARGAAALAALGATAGTALDGIHTHTGTTEYGAPVAWRAAWWVPLLFAGAALAVGLLRPAAEAALGPRGPAARAAPAPPGAAAAGAGFALFVLAYALSGVLPAGRAPALAAVFAVAWAAFDRTALGLALAAVTAAGGAAVELTLIHAGAFRHLRPDVFGLPWWLPWLYATGAIALGNLGKRLVAARR